MMDIPIKYLVLIFLVVQNSVQVLILRRSRLAQEDEGGSYISSTAVIMTEFIKLAISISILLYRNGMEKMAFILKRDVILKPWDSLKLMVPAVMYTIQNNLLYLAISNLDPAVFQVTYQLKVVTTALSSVILLNKKLIGRQWFAIVLLMVGVILVQLSKENPQSSNHDVVDSDEEALRRTYFDDSDINQNRSSSGSVLSSLKETDYINTENQDNDIIGLFAILIATLSSGFSGVYFEKVLKGSKIDIWVRNFEMALFSSVLGFIPLISTEYEALQQNGFFQYYTRWTILSIISQVIGGLLVSFVVKYADNILKTFATSIAIIVSCLLSWYFFDFQINLEFSIGLFIVVVAVYMYSTRDGAFSGRIHKKNEIKYNELISSTTDDDDNNNNNNSSPLFESGEGSGINGISYSKGRKLSRKSKSIDNRVASGGGNKILSYLRVKKATPFRQFYSRSRSEHAE